MKLYFALTIVAFPIKCNKRNLPNFLPTKKYRAFNVINSNYKNFELARMTLDPSLVANEF